MDWPTKPTVPIAGAKGNVSCCRHAKNRIVDWSLELVPIDTKTKGVRSVGTKAMERIPEGFEALNETEALKLHAQKPYPAWSAYDLICPNTLWKDEDGNYWAIKMFFKNGIWQLGYDMFNWTLSPRAHIVVGRTSTT